jgi:acetyl-CoA acetyltransferase
MNESIVIVRAARTPMGGYQGDFASLAAHDLGGAAIRAAVESAGICADAVGEVLFGNCLMAGQGQAPARQAAFKGGLPKGAGAVTLSKILRSPPRSFTVTAVISAAKAPLALGLPTGAWAGPECSADAVAEAEKLPGAAGG